MNYKGEVDSNGYLNGYCEIEFDNGDVYKGNISRNKKDGYGELLFSNGDKYYGSFINDEMTGKGTIITSSYRYEGDLLRGKFNGQGKLSTSSMTYTGQFSNDKKDGYGELIQGQLRYVGFFKNDKFDGEGSLTDDEGEYRGSFTQGEYNGRGILRLRNGDTFEGNWNNGTPDGYFKISSKDYTFEGNMSNGKKEGRGTIRYTNGEVVEGEFSNDKLIKSYNQKEVKEVNVNTSFKSSSPTYSTASNNVVVDYSRVDKNSRFAQEEAILESSLESLYKNFARRESSIIMDFMKEAREEGKSYDNFVSYTFNICQVTRPNHKYRGECCGRDCYHGCGQLKENDSYYYGQFNFHQKEGIGSYTINNDFRIRGHFKANKVHGFAVVYLKDDYYKGYFENGRLKTDYIEYYKNKQLYFRGSVYDIVLNGSIIGFNNGELFENNKVFKGTFVNNKKSQGELYVGSIKYVGKYVNGELDGEVDKYVDGKIKKVLFKNGKELYALDEVKEIRRENYVYKGALKDDKRHGYGECKYDDGGYYLGFWYDDCWYGEGFVRYNSGDEYTGLFNKYMREGYGELIFKSGGFYKGIFHQNKCHGKGHFKYNDGNEYIGDFIEDKRYGSGEMKYADGGYYKGSWKEDYWHGKGYVKYNSGDEYTGEFNMNKRDGQGELKEKNGNYYKGQFKDNCFHGKGYLKYGDGSIYEGSFYMSNMHGYGECKYISGIIYKGNWVNNKWEGFGEVCYSDGSSYKGMFENFIFKGQGEYISPSKEKYVGNFSNNLFDGYMKVYNQKGLLICEGDYKAGKKHGVVKENNYALNGSFTGYISYYYEDGNPRYIVEMLKNGLKTTGKFTLDTFMGFGNQYFGDHLLYRGEFYYGNKSGRGIMFVKPSENQEIIYDGDYFNGNRYGYTISTENNKTLKAYYKNNKPSFKKESSYLPSKKTLLEQDRTTFDFYRREYHSGFYSGMFMMGICYLEGRHIEKNPNFAFKYFKESAEYYPLSDIKLGICYLFGYGVEENAKLAFKILSNHDDKLTGNFESLYHLGYCYEFGKGTKIDYKKAMYYYDLACTSETITFNTSIEYNRCREKLLNLYKK